MDAWITGCMLISVVNMAIFNMIFKFWIQPRVAIAGIPVFGTFPLIPITLLVLAHCDC